MRSSSSRISRPQGRDRKRSLFAVVRSFERSFSRPRPSESRLLYESRIFSHVEEYPLQHLQLGRFCQPLASFLGGAQAEPRCRRPVHSDGRHFLHRTVKVSSEKAVIAVVDHYHFELVGAQRGSRTTVNSRGNMWSFAWYGVYAFWDSFVSLASPV